VIDSVAVLGGGAWGTALALTAARAGRRTTLWARSIATVNAIRQRRENPKYLAGIVLDAPIAATAQIAEAVVAADLLIVAVPAQSVRALLGVVARHAVSAPPLIIAAKGLERGTAKRMTQVAGEAAPKLMAAVLSGPSFALDVARGLPTAVTIAATDERLALALCRALGHGSFRPYAETDVLGVEIGGAVKNVLAIAAGIVAGRQLGASAVAALAARGFAELRRLGEALGARPDTLMGLSGLGDLVLTTSTAQSRNFSYGIAIGEGRDRGTPHPLAEGIETAAVTRELARRHGVDMPIVEAVTAVLAGAISVDEAMESLMSRPLKREAG
jgi:glycerol-3-phosphate dehydrogenase (NAD(P)+)